MEIPSNLPETAANGKEIYVHDLEFDEIVTASSDSVFETDETITTFATSKKSIAANTTPPSASTNTTSASTTETSGVEDEYQSHRKGLRRSAGLAC